MQYKHIVKSSCIKAFLSSSMKNQIYIEQRSAIITFFDRMPLYELFAIESSASPDNIMDRYISEIKKSDIVILILQEDLREGVVKEVHTAMRTNKRIFAYIHSGEKTKELEEFIRDEIQDYATTVSFENTVTLIDKIEKDLLEDLVSKYVDLYKENLYLKRKLQEVSSQNHQVTYNS